MTLSAGLLPQFDQVIAGTRQHLESIPDDELGWKPHEKSYSLGELGSHLANIPNWMMATIGQDELDVAPPAAADDRPAVQQEYESSAAMVAALDEAAGQARAVLESASDETLMGDWTLKAGGETKFTLPKVAVVRLFIMDHMIHHRGQLTVYLRMLDVPVKQTFGPTADFPDM
ncbi:MAG TPA: DinB family protein [Alphaproteobacteria bacterium]|nr:DinB family protein [Alphaproteobacteria bacterium]